eukprot:gene924-2578_t
MHKIGDFAQLCGLTGAPHLNDERVLVQFWSDQEERFAVEMVDIEGKMQETFSPTVQTENHGRAFTDPLLGPPSALPFPSFPQTAPAPSSTKSLPAPLLPFPMSLMARLAGLLRYLGPLLWALRNVTVFGTGFLTCYILMIVWYGPEGIYEDVAPSAGDPGLAGILQALDW